MSRNILTRLSQGVVGRWSHGVAFIRARGGQCTSCYDGLNLTDPDLVASIHVAYVQAGAEVVETNTFGANRIKLGRFELGRKVREINLRGAELASARAGPERFVVGAMAFGAFGVMMCWIWPSWRKFLASRLRP